VDALLGHAGLNPVALGFVIARHAIRALKNRHIKPVYRNLKAAVRALARNQLPGKTNRLALEVVSKAEIPSISKNV